MHLTQAASPGGISIHALLAESDGIQAETAVFVPPISIHALLAESDRGAYRGARQSRPISIHALLAESDKNTSIAGRITEISIHALLAESDNQCKIDQKRSSNFYPRSPCGERQSSGWGIPNWESISIPALLAEWEFLFSVFFYLENIFLSTLSLRRATTCGGGWNEQPRYFYPRSPCGERPDETAKTSNADTFLSTLSLRRATGKISSVLPGFANFYPRSPCGERHQLQGRRNSQNVFLSTLSLRRATPRKTEVPGAIEISIHALLAESDLKPPVKTHRQEHFYPRSPCGERRHEKRKYPER